MEKEIMIDGRAVPFKATARTPILYRSLYGKDIFKDLQKLSDEMKKAQDEEGESTIGVDTLNIFVNVAHCMARQADKTVPADIEEWLDQFSMFSIYQVLPEILELWNLNMTQISVAKKNIEAMNGA